MKIRRQKAFLCRDGIITLIFITLLAIMMILVTVNLSALARLHRQEKMLEQMQLQRLGSPPTNSVALNKKSE